MKALLIGLAASMVLITTDAQRLSDQIDEVGQGVADVKAGQVEIGDKMDVVLDHFGLETTISWRCHCLIPLSAPVGADTHKCMLLGQDMNLYHNASAQVTLPLAPGHSVEYTSGPESGVIDPSLTAVPLGANMVSGGHTALGLRVRHSGGREMSVRFLPGHGHMCYLYIPNAAAATWGADNLMGIGYSAVGSNKVMVPVTSA